MLAIIIPYYKNTFFEATLQSLADQTDKRFNVYIGDDASPNDCATIVKQFEGKFDFIYHRFENNLGSSSLTQQWERCIALSNNEEWLMILGDDDVLGANVVEEFYKAKSNIEYCNVIRFASKVIKDNSISEVFFHPTYEKAPDFILRKLKNETRSSLSEYIFSRSVYNKYKFADYPLAWYSDDRAWIEFSENKNIYTINEAVISIRVSDESISGKKDNFSSKNKAKELFYNFLISEKKFDTSATLYLLLEYEITIKNNRKMQNEDWKTLFIKYFTNFKIVPFLKFTRRYFRS